MRVLLINGSPKGSRSNTYRLATAFLAGMQAHAPLEQEEITVKEQNIQPCKGCFICWQNTPGKCCIADDMSDVIQKMLWADVILWSFPLYYFSVPGPLKNLMDRQLPMVLPFMSKDSETGGHPSRYDMSGKRHVVISTCGFYTAQGNYQGVDAVFDHLCGKGNYTSIYCGQGELFRVKELAQRTDAYLSVVSDAGREFCQGTISRETREKLSQLLYPRETFEAMADASWGVEKTGQKSDESLVFTRQMAALYRPAAWPGRDIVLEMRYTDINKRYQILLGKDGSRVLTEDFLSPTTCIETTYTLWKAIAAGDESGQDALMQGKYRVTGDFNLMIRWDTYFGGEEQAEQPKQGAKPTNMTLLLLPWIAFWIAAASIETPHAAFVSILITALGPLMLYKNRLLIYDRISIAMVTAYSILLLMSVEMGIVLPLSYLGFGMLWTVNGLGRIPLTAHYSQNDYGGEAMLENPLFIKTNRILTLCWGILYLAMTFWTFVLMRMGFQWVATMNSLLPLAMSIFTIWFQKWYPAKVARGD